MMDQNYPELMEEAASEITRLRTEVAALKEEREDLRGSVVAFCGVWAAQYAKEWKFPDGHLHPTHCDILEKAGARMVDFVRHEPEHTP